MYAGRVTSRLSRSLFSQCRSLALLHARQRQLLFPVLSNHFHSLRDDRYRVISSPVSTSHASEWNSISQHLKFSSTATPRTNDKEAAESQKEEESDKKGATVQENGHNKVVDQNDESDSDFESGLSRDELVKLVVEKEELLAKKQRDFEQTKDKLLRSYAELQNVMERTKRDAENSKKFAIQNFAKGLLDVADNLGRASSVVKDSFSKIDTSKDTTGAVPLLKTLLEGVEMTEKQLAEVFKKFGIQKYASADEQFDPHRHNAVFQVPDPTKAPGTVAVVLKAGYTLFDRVIRPAEVGVTVAAEKEADEGTKASEN